MSAWRVLDGANLVCTDGAVRAMAGSRLSWTGTLRAGKAGHGMRGGSVYCAAEGVGETLEMVGAGVRERVRLKLSFAEIADGRDALGRGDV